MNTPLKLFRTILVAGVATAAIGTSAASAQGFFESLFGGGAPQPREGRSAYERDFGRQNNFFGNGYQRQPASGYGEGTLDPNDPSLQREMRRRAAPRAKHEGASGSAGRQTAVAPTDDAPRGSVAYFAKDKTLRSGDVVVTEKGFLVYQGGSDHGAKSFVAINSASGLKGEKRDLLALEQVSSLRTPNTTIQTIMPVRDFVGPRTLEQLDIEAQLAKPAVTAAR